MPPIENVIADNTLQEESKAAPANKAAPATKTVSECPHCSKMFINLNSHITKSHTKKTVIVEAALAKDGKKGNIAEEGEEGRKESKNALIAKSGNKAQKILCISPEVLKCLGEQFFHKEISKCEEITDGKKTDIIFTFTDGTHTNVQQKNGTGGGRGWSFNRQDLENLKIFISLKNLLKTVCLKGGGERNVVPNDKALISRLFLGEDEKTKPQHVIQTKIKDGKIEYLSICPADKFIESILNHAYENCLPKRTCVHLSPLVYLQRKGGGKKDHSPDDIQAKLRAMPDCMTVINLNGTNSAQ
jgi:hypothetical protein